MSKTIISLKNVSKRYRIFKHPIYQMLDFLNPAWAPESSWVENRALEQIDIEIARGSKIGIVGQNGSGKSTLLKLMAQRIKPTSGEVSINGRIGALLELGTGFHPDFTGTENVFSALAYMGIVGKEAKDKFSEIVDFAELENYIDQPVRVYSSGMYTRLAFSVATCARPEILLVDEVLSVGDSYFSHKSLEKMKELSSEENTAVVFVSHNLQSLVLLCDTLIWLDNGEIKAKGGAIDILNRYDLFIREEEERRLMLKKAKAKETINFPDTQKTNLAGDDISGGRFKVNEVKFQDEQGTGKYIYHRGECFCLAMKYQARDLADFDTPVFKVGISREDGLTVTSSIFKIQVIEKEGQIKLIFPQLLLNKGSYFVTILVYDHLDLEGMKNRFYTIDKHVLEAHIRQYEFKVEGSLAVESTVFAHPYEVRADGVKHVELLNFLGKEVNF